MTGTESSKSVITQFIVIGFLYRESHVTLLEELGRCGGLPTYLMFTQLLFIFLTLIWFVSHKISVGDIY
jgi:hypothetical protein